MAFPLCHQACPDSCASPAADLRAQPSCASRSGGRTVCLVLFTNCNLISPLFAFCCCAKHHDQKQSGEGKGLFRLTRYGPSLREAGQEPGVRNWSREYGGTVTIHLLSTICSACFLILPKSSTQGWHCPLWTLPFTLIINLENILQTWL